jgi:hypothetical protein
MKTRYVKWMAAVLLSMAGAAMGQNYNLNAGTPVIYEVTITTELPNNTRTTVGYLAYKPQSVDAGNGQAKLTSNWGVSSVTHQADGNIQKTGPNTPAFLAKDELAKPTGTEVVIDKLGTIVRMDASADNAQVGDGLGPAAELLLLPLPPAGQKAWNLQRKLTMYHEKREATGPQRGPWGRQEKVTRVETPAEESIDFTAATNADGLTIVRRKYRLASLEKVGDTPVNETTGDGYYAFNPAIGAVQSCEFKLVSAVNAKNMTVKVPITVSAKLVADDVLAKMQTELAETQAKQKEQQKAMIAARQERERLITSDLPQGMQRTELVGYHPEQGGPMVQVNPQGKPMIGVKYVAGEWGGHKAFRVFEAVFEEPRDKKPNEVYVMAKEGFVVTSITVNGMPNNGTPGVPALFLTFAKRAGDTVDQKTAYNSPWLGKQVGDVKKKLGGNGQIVYGICGRHGLNLDNLGVITKGGAAKDEPAKD